MRLIENLGPTDGALAWPQVRERLAQPFASDILDVLFDTQLKTAVVVDRTTDVRELIAHGRPVRLVELALRRREITEAVRRLEQVVAPKRARARQSASRRPKAGRAPGDAG
jgi:hypothetical protein